MTQHVHPGSGPRRLTRRSVLGLVAGVGATSLLAACSSARQGTTASTQVPAATTPQAPAAKQTLTGTATPTGASPAGASPAASPSPSPAGGVTPSGPAMAGR